MRRGGRTWDNQVGTDLDGAASGLSAVGLQASSRSEALSRLQCRGQHLGPEVLASARGWQTPQAVAREAEQAAETGQHPTCPAQHPIPPSRRWLDKYCELLGKLGSRGWPGGTDQSPRWGGRNWGAAGRGGCSLTTQVSPDGQGHGQNIALPASSQPSKNTRVSCEFLRNMQPLGHPYTEIY